MIKHIVLFNVKEGEDKDAVAAVAAQHLEPLVGQIPGLISLEVKRCFAGCDFALYSILESKESPRVVFSLQEGIVGPNLYPSGKEGYLCFEAYCRGKGSVSLLYSVHRKAFAVLERPSGTLARARFSEDEETVTLVEGNGSSLQFVIDTLTRIPPERPEETPESMGSSSAHL